MQEAIEQALDYLKGIWLKRRYIIISTWLICPLAWVYVAQLDDVYKSEARVFADTQSILGPLLKGMMVETDSEAQIRLMVRTLLSRPNLERIARMSDLDIQTTDTGSYEALIGRLKRNISIEKTGDKNQNLFKISFSDKNPAMAKDVVQSVITVFIENTLGENRSDSDTAQRFLISQIKEYENKLLQAEGRLTAFKQKYSDVLPNQTGGYYSKLNKAKEELRATELTLLETESQLASLKKNLSTSSSQESKTSSKIVDGNSIQTTYDERIKELEVQLDSLQLRYTEQHPDVKEGQRRLAHLNKQRDAEIKEYLAASDSSDKEFAPLSLNPVVQEIQIQMNQLEGQVASLKVRAKNSQAIVKELETKIHILPEIEAELVALDRGYNITKEQYESLLSRKEKAVIAEKADATSSQINFKVIDPPLAPTKPAGPKRILLYLAITIFSWVAGAAISFAFSQINPVVTSSNQVAKMTGIPVFGIVSAAENLGLQRWHKRKTILFILSNSLIIILLGCFITYSLFPEAIQLPFNRIF